MLLRLEVSVRLQAVDEDGQVLGYGGGLEIRETATVNVPSFFEAAKVLGQFHDLTTTLQARDQSRRR